MKLSSLQTKQLRTAIYTSPVIGVLGSTPIFIAHSHSFGVFHLGVLLVTALVFCIWMINMGITGFYGYHSAGKWSHMLRYLLSYLFVLLFILFLKHTLGPLAHNGRNVRFADYASPEYYYLYFAGFAINTIVLIIQNLIILREKTLMLELENSRLKLRNAEAINQKLKQQIHPHFLFNSLNTLKILTKKHPNIAENYVLRLSGFLRSALSSDDINTVKVSEELKLCIDYLEMQKIRFGKTLQYTVNVPEEMQDTGLVPPFSIQSLLENAIKHNAMSQDAPLHVRVDTKEGWISVSNNRLVRINGESSTGMGLKNLAERYRMLSGDEVLINSTADHFSVSIKILERERFGFSPESMYLNEKTAE